MTRVTKNPFLGAFAGAVCGKVGNNLYRQWERNQLREVWDRSQLDAWANRVTGDAPHEERKTEEKKEERS